jgi:FtsZ-interacting cell division protein ZipA
MLNIAEILTIIVGFLLALVFIDGIRRSIRIKKNKLKVTLTPVTKNKIEEENELEIKTVKKLINEEEFLNDDPELPKEVPILNNHTFIIFNLSSEDLDCFSYSSINKKLFSYKYFFEDKGIFTLRDNDGKILFSLLNSKKPGSFLNGVTTSTIALVLDPSNTPKVVESFDLMFSLAKSFSEKFSCNLLDENRNPLTKQMLEHMRNKSQEYQRQHLADVS